MPSTTVPPAADSSKSEASEPTKTQAEAPQSNGTPSKSEIPASAPTTSKLSGAELKKQKQAEKAARRILQKQGGQTTLPQTGPASQGKKAEVATQRPQGANQANGEKRKTGSIVGEPKHIPIRGAAAHTPALVEAPKAEDKTVELFRHLYRTRTTSIAGANKEVHPAVLALGLQMSNYTICGSCARLVATLQAFKRVRERVLECCWNSP